LGFGWVVVCGLGSDLTLPELRLRTVFPGLEENPLTAKT